jgi:hypothetical protein
LFLLPRGVSMTTWTTAFPLGSSAASLLGFAIAFFFFIRCLRSYRRYAQPFANLFNFEMQGEAVADATAGSAYR